MGKYTKFESTLPRMLDPDAKYQDKINARKAEIIEGDPLGTNRASLLAAKYVAVRKQKAEVNKLLRDVNLELEAYGQLISDAFEREGVTNMKLAAGVRVESHLEPYAQVTDRDAFRLWCIEQGLERSLQLPWGTTNSLVKERLVAGAPEPPGVSAFMKSKVKAVGLGTDDEDDNG